VARAESMRATMRNCPPRPVPGNTVLSVGAAASAAPTSVLALIERLTRRACSRSCRLLPDALVLRARSACAAAAEPKRVAPIPVMAVAPVLLIWYCTADRPAR